MDFPSRPESNRLPAPDSAPATGATRVGADFDLFCLSCAYNLRGLPGDPILCPECGFGNPASEVAVPAQAIRALVRRMESDLSLSTLCILILVATAPLGIGAFLSVIALAGRNVGFPAAHVTCACLMPVVSGVALPLLIWDFRGKCGNRAGWIGAFIKYQLLAFAMCALVLLPFGVGWYLLSLPRFSRGDGGGLVALLIAVAALSVILVAWRLHGRLRNLIAPLRHDIAIHLVRDYMRRTQRPIVKPPRHG